MSKRTKQKLQITPLEDRTTPDASPFHLDPSFGIAGQTYITPDIVPTVLYGSPLDSALRPDGKIWVLGTLAGAPVLARFNPNGTLDTTFDGDGLKSIVPWSDTTSGLSLSKLAMTQDGGVILGGSVTVNPNGSNPVGYYWGGYNTDFVAIKLTTSGAYDATFGDGGHVTIDVDTPDQTTQESLVGMGITTDGKVVLAGNVNQNYFAYTDASVPRPLVVTTDSISPPPYYNQKPKFAIVRLTADGKLDNTYDVDGKFVLESSADHLGSFQSVAIDPSGVVIVGGTRRVGADNFNFLYENGNPPPPATRELYAVAARVTADGHLDTTFDGDGYAEILVRNTTAAISPYSAPVSYGQWVGIQPDGHIVVGTTTVAQIDLNGMSLAEFDLVRFDQSGHADSSYGDKGFKRIDLSIKDAQYQSLTVVGVNFQSDGSVFVAIQTPAPYPVYPVAFTVNNSLLPATTLFRFTADGTSDTRLSPDGKLPLPQSMKGSTIQGSEVLVDPAGRLIVIGSTDSTTAQAYRIGLMRLTQQTPAKLSGPLVLTGTDGSSQQFATDVAGKLVPNGVSTPASATGHARSIRADVDGDGFTDTIYFDGPGGGSNVVVVRGVDPANPVQGAVSLNFNAYEESYKGGIYLAAADLDGDGGAELIVSPDAGGGARIEVFKLKGLQFVQLDNFIAFNDTEFRGGAHVATGDVNGDGTPDLVVSAGVGGGPRVAVYDGKGMTSMASSPRRLMGDFFTYDDANSINLRNGVTVSVADLNGDGKADLVFGAGVGGGPRVYALDAAMLNTSGVATAQANPLANFFCSDPNGRGGISLVVKQASDNTPYLAVTGGDLLGKVYVYRSQDFLQSQTSTPAVFQQIELPGNTLQGVYVG